MAKRRSLFLITHTHWDREWYFALEEYRFRLVRLFDSLLEIIARQPDYRSYWLDGQTILIEDYLAVRPEKRAELTAAIRAKKILVGPFYVSADEFIVAGEACVRNLLIGVRQMRALGQANLFGYLADIFGHVSQMPQILRGFGIDNAFFWRGYPEKTIKGAAEQLWTGADGSRVIAICLVRGYSSAARIHKILESAGEQAEQWSRELEEPGQFLDKLKDLRRFCKAGPILMMNGIDHSLPLANLRQIIRRLEAIQPDLEVRHASLADYLDKIRGRKLPADLPRGELRFVPGLESTASSRISQKTANARVEDLLLHYAEPLSVLAKARGGEIAPGFLERAWKLTVKNHAHDSICGCHADSVALDFSTRFRRAEQIGQGVVRDALARLSGQIAAEEAVADKSHVWLYQPCGWERKGPVELELDLPSADAVSGISLVRSGKEIPAQVVSIKPALRARYDKFMIPSYKETVLRARVVADLGALPATSITVFGINVKSAAGAASGGAKVISPEWGVLDNGVVRVNIRGDGSFDMAALRGGPKAVNLNRLLDEPDGGSLYHFKKNTSAGDVLAAAIPGAIDSIENGPLRAAYRVSASLASNGVAIPLTMEISLTGGDDYVRIHAEIDNRAGNHRLCASSQLPQGLDRIWAHTPFDVVERKMFMPEPIAYARDSATSLQFDKGWLMRPMQALVAAVGRRGALFVLSKGLYEYFQPRKNLLNVTLLRACGLISPNFLMYDSSGGQCRGKVALDYAIGLCGQTTPAKLLKKAIEFRLPPHAYQTYGQDPAVKAMGLFSVSRPDWIISAIKRSEDGKGIIVRVFSLASRNQAGMIRTGLPAARAFLVRLDETRLRELKIKHQAVRLELGPRKIATVFFAL